MLDVKQPYDGNTLVLLSHFLPILVAGHTQLGTHPMWFLTKCADFVRGFATFFLLLRPSFYKTLLLGQLARFTWSLFFIFPLSSLHFF